MHRGSDVRAKPCRKERDAAQGFITVPGVTPLQHARVTAASEGTVMKIRRRASDSVWFVKVGRVRWGGHWAPFAKSGPLLTCSPAISCLLVIPSLLLWRAVQLQSRWEAHAALWMTDSGPSPACTHLPACLPLHPVLLNPPDPRLAAES